MNKNCTNLELGVAYCVQPVGSIAEYEGYTHTVTDRINVAPATSPSVNTAIATPTNNPGFVATSTAFPMARGTVSGCDFYAVKQDAADSCSNIAFLYDVSTADLLEWNPSLNSDMASCSLEFGKSYFVGNLTTVYPSSGSHCLRVSSTVEGTISTCNCYTIVKGYEVGGEYYAPQPQGSSYLWLEGF